MNTKTKFLRAITFSILAVSIVGCSHSKDVSNDEHKHTVSGATSSKHVFDILNKQEAAGKVDATISNTDELGTATIILKDGKSTLESKFFKKEGYEILTYFDAQNQNTTIISPDQLSLSSTIDDVNDICLADKKCSINVIEAVERISDIFDDYDIDIEDAACFRNFKQENHALD